MRISKYSITTVASSALFLSSCVSPPSFHLNEITPNDILLNLKCEVSKAVAKKSNSHAWLKLYSASILLNLQVQKSNASTGNASLRVPLEPGFVTPKLALGLTTQATRTMNFKTKFDIAKLGPVPNCLDRSGELLLEGDLGIIDYLNSMKHVNYEPSHSIEDSSYKLDFAVTKSLTPSSAWSLIPVNNDVFGANVSAILSTKNTHTLTFTITPTPPDAGDPDPLEVIIVADQTKIASKITKLKQAVENQKKVVKDQRLTVNILSSKNLNFLSKDDKETAKLALTNEKTILTSEKNKLSKLNSELRNLTVQAKRKSSRRRRIESITDRRLRAAELRGLLQDVINERDQLR